ncbi:hypothetical protein POM88_030373 [Heracleum sosnowskyi]|uniref:ELK domain-containing protein n=1 Tax=Heracleum sosnowskyi TaxID=360622 RepID=A0AAD8HVT4_9APIA|nr:hypothetical protein POM88_030373 [Heracleum sosnowskyi]
MLPMFKFVEGSSCNNADNGCDTPSSSSEPQNLNDIIRRRLAAQSSNLSAAPASQDTSVPWKTGLSGQLQKAFVTGSADEDDLQADFSLDQSGNDVHDMMGFGPLLPTESERSLMERVRQELKIELKQGFRSKLEDVREEILRKRRAGKLPGDTTSVLKDWWQQHSKWPYPIVGIPVLLNWIATVQMGQLKDCVEAANELASLARDNNRNMKIIVQEGGVAPLLKLLKDGASDEAQMAAVTALYNLGTDQEKVKSIVSEVSTLSIVVKAIGESPMRVQIVLVNLVARMAELDEGVQEDLGRENVTRPLVTLLGMDIVVEEAKTPSGKPTSIHSLVQINKEVSKKKFHSTSSLSLYSDGSSRGGRKEREAESPDMKHGLKISYAGALLKLCREGKHKQSFR